MTIDETIKREKEIHKDNQMVVETHIVHEDFTLEELYCDDTEVIEEHLENYRFASEYHKQIAEWLEELKANKDTSADVYESGYKRGYSNGYANGIDEFAERCNKKITEFILEHQQQITFVAGVSMGWNMIDEIAEEMKGGCKDGI